MLFIKWRWLRFMAIITYKHRFENRWISIAKRELERSKKLRDDGHYINPYMIIRLESNIRRYKAYGLAGIPKMKGRRIF